MSNLVEVIAEIGINWDGDFDLLFEMINKSKESGCNAVKLQSFERTTCNNHPETERLLKSSVTEKNIEKVKVGPVEVGYLKYRIIFQLKNVLISNGANLYAFYIFAKI